MDRATAQQVNQPGTGLAALRAQLRAATLRPEADASGELLADLSVARAALERAATRAARWVETARADQRSRPLVDRMLEQFPLDSAQGKALMSLAEALLRTPDPRRADQLIAERLASVRAAGVPGDTDLLLRTGFTLLGAAGRLLPEVSAELSGEFSAASLARPMIAPIVRAALRQSMQLLGHAFIVGETIDAALARGPAGRSWRGPGRAVRGSGRRAPLGRDRAGALARPSARRMTVRLVKGAYWDSEIKRAQERGLASFPVYTSKAATDASYLECARQLFAAGEVIYPQFATHNAYTVAAVLELAPASAAYEFQRLHGMGEALYEAARAEVPALPPVRVYAPVGTHEDLLPYLVRRLLENGANSSFVHQFMNPQIPVEQVVRDPVSSLTSNASRPTRVREPRALFGAGRANSEGQDFGDPAALATLQALVQAHAGETYVGGPILSGRRTRDAATPVTSPADTRETVGLTRDASAAQMRHALQAAQEAQPHWDARPAAESAACLTRAADLLQQRRGLFLSLLVREAGKTLPDAVAELREALDFCRFYAARGEELFGAPLELPGPTGESNTLSLHGRGVFVCISPWNFPLAIFTGQITAALVAGNAVVAKPAPATPLIAHAMTCLLHEAGVPAAALQLTPADGPAFGKVALTHPALAGVAFTGSTATAATINRTLANRDGAIVPLIAKTGGVNAMVVDATALPEQVVDDVITSAFTSAGQRCSALRVLYLQEEIAARVIAMLIGAMRCLKIGAPADLATDVGPVISQAARQRLQQHAAPMRAEAKLLYACELESHPAPGHFFAPQLFELRSLDQLKSEEFGPILHVARYRSGELPQVLEAIRSTGFGLTLGVHSRLESVARHVFRSLPVGNTYVNRNMIGAVVGVQPFGGQGLSGTGPKAGGPHYLLRFATERTLTINTAAIGGNVELLS